MSKKIIFLSILVCILLTACHKGQNENKQTQTENKIEENTTEESESAKTVQTVIESSPDCAIPNK